jgi:hypothetical protein
MIVKIKLHKKPAFRKLLEYILNDKDRLFDKAGKSFVVTRNLKGNSIDNWEKQFRENEIYRLRKRTDSVYLSHEILSWHREDAKNISLEKMELMTKEYIGLRNPKGIFVATPHFDKEHFHVHILVSGIEYKSGKGMRLSKIALSNLKKDIQQYQQEKFPELSKSIITHGKKESRTPKTTEKEYQLKYRTGRETEKEKVIAKINICYNKADSKEFFFKSLNECGLKTYERAGRVTGVVVEKYKFRFKRIGFTEAKLEELDKTQYRKAELSQSRVRDKNRNFRKER